MVAARQQAPAERERGEGRTEADFAGFFEELHAEFAHPRTWRLYPDALPTLKAMNKLGRVVGIVSNWDERLFELCDGLKVTPWVDFVLASAVEGTSKPDREIFRRALAKAGGRPSEALHVGDSYREDYCGAKKAGLKALLLCRRTPPPAGVPAIKSLKELPIIISTLGKRPLAANVPGRDIPGNDLDLK